MKLKYYLRGLGAGILFSVLIFVFVVGNKETEITDEEIIQRAKQLGMKESSIDMDKLREPSGNPTPTLVPTLTPTPTPGLTLTPTPVADISGTPTPSPTDMPTPSATPTPTSTPVPTPTSIPEPEPDDGMKTAKIEVVRGMRSEQICILLQDAGIIEDAEDFNRYLIENGYADEMRIGKFELNSKMSYERIAKRLTGK